MSTRDAFTGDQTIISSWIRDYRLSLALFAVGIVVVVAYLALSFGAYSTGNYPTSFGAGLAIYLTGTAGGMLILLAGTVAYYHWRGLQLIRGNA
ncbi:MAG: hypothetical protein ACREEC_10030 [Thermoplasmata archaeon]